MSCLNCDTHWQEVYLASARTGIEYDPLWAEFGGARKALEDIGAKYAVEHTGGGVHVLYIRSDYGLGELEVPVYRPGAEIPFPIEHPFIGVSPVEDYTGDGDEAWLVMAYDHNDDEGTVIAESALTDELVAVIEGAASTLTNRHQPMIPVDARHWAEANTLAQDWHAFPENTKMYRGWALERLDYGNISYKGESNGHSEMWFTILRLTRPASSVKSHLVHWNDGVVNEWNDWSYTADAAHMFLGKLVAAVTTGVHLDELEWAVQPKPSAGE
jgi:hypothetical protein